MYRTAVTFVAAVLLAGALVAAPAATPAGAQTVGITNDVEAIERTADGDLVVLERVGQARRSTGRLAHVHRYDGWGATATTATITNATLPANESTDLVDLVPADAGGWWLVAANGTAYRVTNDGRYAGDRRTLERPGAWPTIEAPHYRPEPARWIWAAERGPDGSIWVAGRYGLLVYDAGFENLRRGYRAVYSEEDYGVAGLEVARGAVWVLGTDGLRRYDLADGSRLADQRAVSLGGFHGQVSYDTDLEPATGGDWMVVNGGGSVKRVTGSLVYTGVAHEVGSDAAYPGTPSDILVLAPPFWMIAWAVGALAVAWVLGVVLLWGRDRDCDPRGYVLAAAVGPPTLLAMYTEPWPLRPLVFQLPVPDATVPLATLLAVAGHLVALRREGLGAADVRATAGAHVPLTLAAAVLLGKLLGLL